MITFEFNVEDAFNIKGRGTVIVGTYEGTLIAGDYLLSEKEDKIFVSAIDMPSYGKKIGLCIRFDFEDAKKLIGTKLKKKL